MHRLPDVSRNKVQCSHWHGARLVGSQMDAVKEGTSLTRKMMQGWKLLAMSNTPLMAFSLSPAHLERIMDGLMDSSMKPASAATFSTSSVLPVPAGPCSRKARAGWRMPLNLRAGAATATAIKCCQQPLAGGGPGHAMAQHANPASCARIPGLAAAATLKHSQVRELQWLKHGLLQLELDIPACITGHHTQHSAAQLT